MSADDPVIDAATVTDELTALRHRGLLNVEGTRSLAALQLPALDALATRFFGESALVSRRIRLQRYLEAALNAYQEAGNTSEVDFIRPLFFDLRPETERIGTRSPGDLLKDARAKTEIKDEKDFRDLQHTYLREFAAFLLASQPGAANIENDDRATPPLESDERVVATSQPGNATQRLVAGLAAALVIALVVIAGLIMELRQRSSAEPPET